MATYSGFSDFNFEDNYSLHNDKPSHPTSSAAITSHRSSSLGKPFGSDHYATSIPETRYYPPTTQSKPSRNNRHSDSIPLKTATRLSTSPQNWQARNDQHPSSPESHTNQQLLPQPGRQHTLKTFFSGRIPWVVYFMTLVQITVFIVEIIKNSIITGSPIMIHPQFNPMIGPSIYVQINMGARFVPCMHTIPGVQDAAVPINWPCPNTTTSDSNASTNHCQLSDLCGFGGLDNSNPNQWFRFITPMFLHAGLIHIGFNMLLQLTMGREMELAIGSVRFALVYFSSGIFGFVLGGNFAATAIASTGASGCLFGVLALFLLDLIYCWNERPHPVRDLMWILADVLISLVLGLLPGLDNFSHIGGFLMGLVAGICILHSPNILRQRIGEINNSPYRNVGSEPDILNPKSKSTVTTAISIPAVSFASEPVGFFKGRKPLWWAWWLLRAGALIGVLVAFVVLLNNFYKYRDTCSWCKYLSCLPINHWCDLGNLQLKNATSQNTTHNKRELARSGAILVTDLWERAGLL